VNVNNILTFDIEDWYHPHLVSSAIGANPVPVSRVAEPTRRILKMLAESGSRATFFVLGCIAESFPELVLSIRDAGHEVASHGYEHRLAYERTRGEFTEDLVRSKLALESLLKQPVLGYRAPTWSLNEKTGWAFSELAGRGFLYDSSLFPFRTYLYGSNANARFTRRMEVEPGRFLIETPPSVIQVFGIRIPFCGGFYFRFFPYRFVRFAVRSINRREKEPVMLYLHPWELDPEQPKPIGLRPGRFIQYHRLGQTESKLRRLLADFRFVSILDFLKEKGWI
jgi:polysaccharide deacetylase family protein (PEP-CTERM system associated)